MAGFWDCVSAYSHLTRRGPIPLQLRLRLCTNEVESAMRRYHLELAFDKECSELQEMRMEFKLETVVNSQGKQIEHPVRSINHRKVFQVLERQIYSTQQILLSERISLSHEYLFARSNTLVAESSANLIRSVSYPTRVLTSARQTFSIAPNCPAKVCAAYWLICLPSTGLLYTLHMRWRIVWIRAHGAVLCCAVPCASALRR
jgi:hypothetical protein